MKTTLPCQEVSTYLHEFVICDIVFIVFSVYNCIVTTLNYIIQSNLENLNSLF